MLETIPHSEQIDVRGGKCTYGQMVDLGRAVDAAYKRGAGCDADTVRALIGILHPDTRLAMNLENVKYALRIVDAVLFWREWEAEKLKYAPTDDEKAAGYEKLAELTGHVGVASTIAEKFSVQGGPDEVFTSWEYAQVVMVLRVDLERYKFQKRLQEVRDRKNKQKAKKWQR